MIDHTHPQVAHALAQVELTRQQKNALLSALRLLSEPDVQSLGYEVALALRQSDSEEEGPVRLQIERRLSSRLVEVRKIRNDMVTPSVRALWGSGRPWRLTLQRENIRVMRSSHGGMLVTAANSSSHSLAHATSLRQLPLEELSYGAWAGVLEHARVFLGLAELAGQGHSLNIPETLASLSQNVKIEDLGPNLLSCELLQGNGLANLLKGFFCPIKYGSQGLDVLRAVLGTNSTVAY